MVITKLDFDCIRDILITVEEYDNFCNYDKIPLTQKYDSRKLNYHINQCAQENLILPLRKYVDGGYLVLGLTPKGHEIIDKIQNDTLWNKIKKQLAPTLSTISALFQILEL